MRFLTGQDYPHLCINCRTIVDQCVDLVQMGEDTDDNEAPIMFAGDHKLMCGGHQCECDCSKGFPDLDNDLDIFCRVHGGTEEEQQTAREKECEKHGHWFPTWTARLKRDWVCLMCQRAYGRWDDILGKQIETVQNT